MAREMKQSPSGETKLEQYGVWVKIEPQELTESHRPEGPFELSDLQSPAESQAPQSPADSQQSLTMEEEKLLDELETEISHEEDALPEQVAVALDEDRLPGLSTQEPQFGGIADIGAEQSMGEVLPELELDDLDIQGEAASSGALAPELLESDTLEMPREAEGAEPPVLEEIPELESDISSEEPLSAELPVEESSAAEVEVPLTDNLPQDHFDDLEALEEELASVTSPSAKTAAKSGKGLSDEVLTRIEDELKSIRSDLTQLKRELTGLKKTSRPPQRAQAGTEPGGFFDEEEDETIALTGDELDNILSTAEVTEEPAEATMVEIEGEGQQVEEAEEFAKGEDILGYDTSTVEEIPQAAPEEAEAAAEDTADTLVLEGETLDEAAIEPLADLELEELGIEGEVLEPKAEEAISDTGLEDLTPEAESPALEDQPEIALESLPESEQEIASAETSEAFELEPLEAEVSAPAEEAVLDLEALPEIETAEMPSEAPAEPEEIDLENISLSGEAQGAEPEDAEASPLELDELEILTGGEQAGKNQEIEIAFEEEGGKTSPVSSEEAVEAEEVMEVEDVPTEAPSPQRQPKTPGATTIPDDLKDEIRTVLKYMDQLLEALPEEKIQEFASSEYFVMYKKLFEDLGLGE
jgi:pilus assembly protein FimV